jgi:hypothetical protein
MSLQKSGHTIVDPYPSVIDACDYCDRFSHVFYVDSETICDECFQGLFDNEDEEE